ncbi:MAG: protein-export chaperone SecB [Gammaproteobacteria bacterium]
MAETQQDKPAFGLQRIYLKEASLETPAAPEIFQKEWKPDVHLDLHTQTQMLDNDTHEVVLTLVVTTKSEDKTAFIVEIKQAGIFTIKGFAEEQLKHILGVDCPTILYPYAREVVTALVQRGSFPQLILAPVNFQALYVQHQENLKQQKQSPATGE